MDAHLTFHVSGRIHLGVCGSVAAYRAPDLVRQWRTAGLGVGVTLTSAALRFISALTFSALGADPVYTAMFDDPAAASPFPHLEPGQCAGALVVAPASADVLTRLASGRADDLLACQILAFEGPVVLAPAMNPRMWRHPAVQAGTALLRERGCRIVPPGCGGTACGDEGQGRLADLRDIYMAGLRAVTPQDMAGLRVLVTLGPTREFWDGVRFWSNPSSGVMGAAFAGAAWLRGAEVHAVCGPGCPRLPACEGLTRHDAVSAAEMYRIASGLWPTADIGVFTAAVADFAPVPRTGDPARPENVPKFKKSEAPDGFSVAFAPNPDILRTLAGARRADRPQRVIGFAAETSNLEQAAAAKLISKQADLIVGNLVRDGFGTASDTVFVLDRYGRSERWADMPKTDLAWSVLTWLLSL